MNQQETTLWENVKNRATFLRQNDAMVAPGAEFAIALCEELERMEARLRALEQGAEAHCVRQASKPSEPA
jgi:hypothetical protein